MRALVFDNGQLRYKKDYPKPSPAPDEALIRVNLTGICNTDLEITRGYMGFNGIPGHEFTGVVETANDKSWIGKRVVGEINCYCGACETCLRGDSSHCPNRTTLGIFGRDGSMAEYCTLPVRNLHVIPEGVSDEHAVFTEPLAAALEITRQIHIRPTDRVAIVGDGKLGLLAAQVLRLSGCSLTLIGHHREKLDIAKSRHVETFMEAETPDDLRADIVVDCTGHPDGFSLARKLIRPRGTLVLKSTFQGANKVNLTSLVVDEITLMGSRCGPFRPALELLEKNLVNVEPLIDTVFSLEDGTKAFQKMGTRGALKVLLK